jgi:insulysin
MTTTAERTAPYQEVTDTSGLQILNPDLKERRIAKIRLKNGLEVLLISDPGADQSSAAVAVEAGSWNDPEEYPGMAHFCEHMLFMGTQKYPDCNAFFNSISDFGGIMNAFTAPDRTVYMFSSQHEGFSQNLDRFSRFFIDPLFNPDQISRELHAVDQEYAKNLEHDGWREYMVFKELNNPLHPNRKFSSGNSKTLANIPASALRKWHLKHYGAERTHLCLYSSLPIETMKAQAVSLFSPVPTVEKDTSLSYQPITSAEQRGHITYIKPIQNRQTITLAWEMPRELSNDETKSADLIAYALNRGQPNSLYECLKTEQLIDAVAASADDLGDKNHRVFQLKVELTPKGIQQADTVIHRCFEAIAGLKSSGIPAYLFDEMNAVSRLGYQFQTRQDAFQIASSVGSSISEESLSSYPREQILGSTYTPVKINAVLERLAPETCCVSFSAPPELTGVQPDKKEKWFGAEYSLRTIPTDWLNRWKSAKPNATIQVAGPNPFVPTKLEPVALDSPSAPQLLSSTSSGAAYYCRAPEFQSPEAVIRLHLRSPSVQPGAKSAVLASLYLDHLTDLLHPTLAAAQSAGLSARFDVDKLKINLQISGFSEKAPLLLQEILKQMPENPPTLDQFNVYFARHFKDYSNGDKDPPFKQAKEQLDSLLTNSRPADEQKLAALQTITYEEFLQYHRKLFEKTYAEALFIGNLTRKNAESCWVDIQHLFSRGTYPTPEQTVPTVLVLPDQGGPFSIPKTSETLGNAALLSIDQGPFSFERKAMQDVLATVLREPFFTELRTKQKTGYIVRSEPTEIEDRLFQLLVVQSNSHQPEDLLYRFELFLEEFLQTLNDSVPQERFETIVQTCVHTLKTRFRNLKDKSALWDLLAFEKGADFGYVEKRTGALQSLTRERFLTLASDCLSRSNRRRLAILHQGKLTDPFNYEPIDAPRLQQVGRYTAKVTNENN